jgi:nucleotide-binding universal stress UspA family protein
MFKRILVPTDGSELSARALEGAVKMAVVGGAKIFGVTVVEPYSYSTVSEYRPESIDEYEKRSHTLGEERLAAIAKQAGAANVAVETSVLRAYSPHEAIIEAARRFDCDLIVMASHGRKGLSAVLLGSETQKVLTHSTIPVLVYR